MNVPTSPHPAPGPPPAPGPAHLPGVVRASVERSRIELIAAFRNVQSLVFTLALPVILLLIFGSVFSGTIQGTTTDFKQVFVSGIIAAGVMSTAFTGLAMSVILEREHGVIRRLASTPMPKSAYFIGKLVRVLVTTLLEVGILLALGALFFGLQLPSDTAHWGTFAWVTLLGITACSLFGLAYTWIIPNARSAAAIVTPPFLVLQFISGVYYPFHQLPSWMQTVSSFFPLKWMTQGFRNVFLPDSFKVVEQGQSWNLAGVATILIVWSVACAVITAFTFAWRGPRVR